MADSFKFWESYYGALKIVPTAEQRSRLIMALCACVFDGVEPDLSDDQMLDALYQIMYQQATTSKEIAERARSNGKRGGRPANYKKKTSGLTQTKTHAKTSGLTQTKTQTKTQTEKRSVAYSSVASPHKGGTQASGASLSAPEKGASARAENTETTNTDDGYQMAPGEFAEMMAEVEASVDAWEAAGRPEDFPVGGEA